MVRLKKLGKYLECRMCKKVFYVFPNRFKLTNNIYCSKKCLYKYRKINGFPILNYRHNFKHTEETKNKMSLSKIGKKMSTKARKNISIAKKGSNSYQWKGGISLNKEYRSWLKNKRNRVLKRIKKQNGTHSFQEWEDLKKFYNHMCLCCKRYEPEIKLTEDHIVPLSKGGSDLMENIQPLCVSCNSKKYTKIINYVNTGDFSYEFVRKQ